MFVFFRTTTWRGPLAGPQHIKHTCHDYCYLPACKLGNWARITDLLYVTVTNFEYTIFVYLMSMHLHQMYKIHGWYRQLGRAGPQGRGRQERWPVRPTRTMHPAPSWRSRPQMLRRRPDVWVCERVRGCEGGTLCSSNTQVRYTCLFSDCVLVYMFI